MNFCLLLLFLLAVANDSMGQSPLASSANKDSSELEDEAAIRETIAGIEKAWNSHDMKAYGALLSDDVHWVNVVGMHWRGHKAVMDAHAAFHETVFRNHQIKTDNVEVRSIGNGIAIAVVTTTNDPFVTPDGSLVPRRQNRQSYVLLQNADRWKIAHCHNVSVDAAAAKSDPVNTQHSDKK